MQKELGISHEEIFGGRRRIYDRGGASVQDVAIPPMNVHTFLAYIDLMEMDREEQEKMKQKQEMQNQMKNKRGV